MPTVCQKSVKWGDNEGDNEDNEIKKRRTLLFFNAATFCEVCRLHGCLCECWPMLILQSLVVGWLLPKAAAAPCGRPHSRLDKLLQ